MKKIILTLTILLTSTICYSDQYVVEFKVEDGVKKQVSSYTIPDGETPDTTNSYVLVTKEEYEGKLGDGTKWEQATTEWLKKSENVEKVDLAIANKPKTDKEILSELKAKVAALEAAKETP